MASDQEIMRLRATVEDDATATIAKIQKAMHAAHQSTKRDQAEHAKQVREQQKAYKELGEAVNGFASGGVGGGIGNALLALGGRLGVVGAALGATVEVLDKVTESIDKLGKRSADLTDLSRQANMTTNDLQRMQSQMEWLNISTDNANKSLTTFGTRWKDLSSGHPTSKAIGEIEDGGISGVYERYVQPNLGIKDTAAAAKKMIDDVKNSGQPDYKQARILSQLGLPPDYAYKSKAEIAEARAKERVALAPESIERLDKSRKSEIESRAAADRGSSETTAMFSGAVSTFRDATTTINDAINRFVGIGDGKNSDENKKAITDSTTAGTKEGMMQAWREIVMGRTSDAELFSLGYKPMAYHPDGGLAPGHGGGTFGSKEYPALDPNGAAARALGSDGSGNGQSRGDRNNNRGNLKFGPLARSFGATHADDRGFAVFPDQASGDAAQDALLKSNAYHGLTLDQFGNKYSEGNSDWKDTVGKALGIGRNGIVDNNDPRLAGAIRKAEGTGGGGAGGQYAGVGGYNFMGSARAIAMGMGDVTHGGPLAHLSWPTGIPKGKGPQSILANKYAGGDMAGFLKDLSDAGAPLDQFAGAYVNKPRQHGFGNALDIETGFGSGPDNSPHLYAWAKAHPKEFAELQAKHHMRNLDTSSGASMHDWGHFEWSPTGKDNFTNAKGLGGAHLSDRVKHGTHHKLSVDFTNMPKGVRTGYNGQPGLFKEVKLNRGRAMGFASQDS